MKLPQFFGVLGSGQMGAGIAQVAAMAGLSVTLVDRSPFQLEKAKAAIASSLWKLARKGKIIETSAQAALDRISTATELEAFNTTEYVVEAVPEDEVLKRSMFHSLDKVTPEHTILASNTSSISITRLASATCRPDKVIGLHFMNPVPIMGLVELVRGMQTSDQTFELTKALVQDLGKVTCVSADRAGFIVNRILMPMINEAFYTLMEGVGTPEDIDTGMRLGTNQVQGQGAGSRRETCCEEAQEALTLKTEHGANHTMWHHQGLATRLQAKDCPPVAVRCCQSAPMWMCSANGVVAGKSNEWHRSQSCSGDMCAVGVPKEGQPALRCRCDPAGTFLMECCLYMQPMGPLTLADFIGLDTCLSIMRVLRDNLGDDKYRPCPLLVQYVDAGWLGRKSGRGVYTY